MLKLVFLFSILGKLAHATEPNIILNLTKAVITNFENPILGEWTSVVNPKEKESTVDIDMLIKDVLPEDTLVNILYGSDKGKQKNMKIKFCDAMHEILIGQDLFSRIMPRDQAPEKCPVQPSHFFLKDYLPNKLYIPPGMLKDGLYLFTVSISGANEEPWATGEFEFEISHDSLIPQLG